MEKATAWDVYLKTREISETKENVAVPIIEIAKELRIGADLAEQYAISLQMLDIWQFDNVRKEIILPKRF
jgi:hypothetical protein